MGSSRAGCSKRREQPKCCRRCQEQDSGATGRRREQAYSLRGSEPKALEALLPRIQPACRGTEALARASYALACTAEERGTCDGSAANIAVAGAGRSPLQSQHRLPSGRCFSRVGLRAPTTLPVLSDAGMRALASSGAGCRAEQASEWAYSRVRRRTEGRKGAIAAVPLCSSGPAAQRWRRVAGS